MNMQDFYTGHAFDAYEFFGAHTYFGGTHFAVWAPSAQHIAVETEIGTFDLHRTQSAVWECDAPGVQAGMVYQYWVRGANGQSVAHCDPYGTAMTLRPDGRSIVSDAPKGFADDKWMQERTKCFDKPLNIYEVHAGSWRQKEDGSWYTYAELAEQYGLRKTNVHLGLQELERLGFLKVVPRHATYVAPYWEQANLETLAAIMTHGGKPQPELVDAFLELREMVALGWFRWTGRNPKTEQMRHLYGLLERMEAIAYAPDGEKDNQKFLDLVNQFLVCMFAESDNMVFRVLLRSSRELAHVTYYIVAYTLDMQELCKTYRTVLDGLTSGHASEAIDYWCGWSDRVTVRYREALLQLGSE